MCVCLVCVSESTWVCLVCVCAPASRNEPRGFQAAASRGRSRNALGYRLEPESAASASRNEPRGSQVLRLAASRGKPRNALGYSPEMLPLPAETSREAPQCCVWQHQGERRRNALRYRPNEPRGSQVLRGSIKGGARNALGHRPEPEVLACRNEKRGFQASRNEPRSFKVLRLAASRGP